MLGWRMRSGPGTACSGITCVCTASDVVSLWRSPHPLIPNCTVQYSVLYGTVLYLQLTTEYLPLYAMYIYMYCTEVHVRRCSSQDF
jgi:hypothetical protein